MGKKEKAKKKKTEKNKTLKQRSCLKALSAVDHLIMKTVQYKF